MEAGESGAEWYQHLGMLIVITLAKELESRSMTMQVQVALVTSAGDRDAVGLEVTQHGVFRELFRLNERDAENRKASLPESVYRDRAILIVEGAHDFGDGVRPEDEYWVNNPLVDFLKREHPQFSLKDELRQRIAKLESENASLRKRAEKAERGLAKVKGAIAE